ncbi:MAG: glycosyltransferase, partial [Verrucomicrobiota bacterium]|nr:glycosyltransferase [Verrucomicrobiota bacterium]
LETRTILSQSDLLLITSQHEGAGRVVGEAVQLGVPIISTNNDGVMGVLGEEYEGYYPVGDVEALTALLIKAEKDKPFLERLNLQCKNKKALFSVEEETKAWSEIINDFFV